MTNYNTLYLSLLETGAEIRQNEALSSYTSFAIGGPAPLVAIAKHAEQGQAVRACCAAANVPCYLLGAGSNLLIRDEGLQGVALVLGRSGGELTRQGSCITADCGVSLAALCRYAQREGLSGLEFAFGIPGSVGGAIYMNAGAYGGEMKDVTTRVVAYSPQGHRETFTAQQAAFGYRHSLFCGGGFLIAEATFALTPDAPDAIELRMSNILARRREKQPLELPSAGSTFKRPAQGYASALIDQSGLKGFSVGAAQVSEKHAGFVVNRGGASCAEVLSLCAQVQAIVLEKTGVSLELEVNLFPAGEGA